MKQRPHGALGAHEVLLGGSIFVGRLKVEWKGRVSVWVEGRAQDAVIYHNLVLLFQAGVAWKAGHITSTPRVTLSQAHSRLVITTVLGTGRCPHLACI